MRTVIIAAAAMAVGFALPAAAQGTSGQWNGPSGQSYNQQQGVQGSNGPQGWQGQQGMHQHRTAELRHQIYQDLSEGGFTDIRVIPRSFIVHAKDRHGNPVMMMISPNSVTALTAAPNQGDQNANQGEQRYGQNNQNQRYGQNNQNEQRYGQNESGQQRYGQNESSQGWNGGHGMMGSSAMGQSAQSGSAINSPNGNGTYVR